MIEAAHTTEYHKNPVRIEKQHMANGKVKDLEMHISGMGISTIFEKTDPMISRSVRHPFINIIVSMYDRGVDVTLTTVKEEAYV